MYCSLFSVTLVLNSVLFWKLHVFKFRLGISEILLCSIFALRVNVILLDALHLGMLFVWTLAYLKNKMVLLIMLYNGTLVIINCI